MTLIAKTNMDEFGMGSHSIHSAYGAVVNGEAGKRDPAVRWWELWRKVPWPSLEIWLMLGIGTDTGGSVRLPAAYMGLVGFKPSYGMISRTGVVSYANSLDTVGILAKSVPDVRLTFG